MRVVGYLREPADATGQPAFAQQEDIRRYAAGQGLDVVAVCQDVPRPGIPLGRDGYRSLLGVLAAGQAEAVVLPGLAALSADVVVQEIMLWDLRARGARVLSTDPADAEVLSPAPAEPTRQFVRDVLARVADYRESLAPGVIPPATEDRVVVHLMPATGAEGQT